MKRYTLKDVVKEMGREVGSSEIYLVAKDFLEGMTSPYSIPTAVKRHNQEIGFLDRDSGFLSILSVCVGIAAPISVSSITEDWRYLLIPVATNLVSGGYELYKKAKKNLEEVEKD